MGTNTIRNMALLTRPVSFAGLPHISGCSPTDVDFIVELTGKRQLLVGDFKVEGVQLTTGQRILLEQTCKAYGALLYTAAAFVAWHPRDVEVVDAASARLVATYNGGWWTRDDRTLGEFYNEFFGREN